MAKSRKKKNYKLRRRVKRTIASLVMIMAIVVAAIPVENFGTMKAAAEDELPTLTDVDYATYFDYANPNADLESGEISSAAAAKVDIIKDRDYGFNYSSYQDDEVTFEYLEGSLVEKFRVHTIPTDNETKKEGIITEYIDKDTARVTINEQEPYGYIIIDTRYMDAVYALLAGETYSADAVNTQTTNEFTYRDEDGNSHSLTSISTERLTIRYNEIQSAASGSLRTVTISNTGSGGGSSSGAYDGKIYFHGREYDNPYTRYSTSKLDTQKILEEYSPDSSIRNSYALWQDRIDDYNNEMADILQEISAFRTKYSGTIASGDIPIMQSEWNAIQTKCNQLTGNRPQDFSVTFAELCGNTSNGVESYSYKLLHDMILDRASADDGIKKLEGGQLASIGNNSYVVRFPNGAPATDQILDSQNCLVTGRVTIKGIDGYSDSSPVFNGLKNITDVSFPNSLEFIGQRAFYGCTRLGTIDFSRAEGLEAIGAEAFMWSGVTSVNFPVYLKTVGAGSFAKCTSLKSIAFSDETTNVSTRTIWPYAFYDDKALTDVDFGDESDASHVIGRGTFAVAPGGYGAMSEFTFPEKMPSFIPTGNNKFGIDDNEDAYDYILSGRGAITKVTFPGNLGSQNSTGNIGTKIPDNTLVGCFALTDAVFPVGADNATYTSALLFKSVKNENGNMTVHGPAFRSPTTNISEPRRCTRTATSMNTTLYPTGRPILYHFEIDGVDYYEVADGDDLEFITTYKIEDNGEATLTNYDIQKENMNVEVEVQILAEVNGHRVTKIAEGCFGAEALQWVYKLVIPDDSVREIEAEAFKGAERLQWVELGDAIETIGKQAFYECKALENVYFSTHMIDFIGDSYWDSYNTLKIEPDAFRTDSMYLTFHGAIHSQYAPFRLAMGLDDAATAKFGSTNRTICYKTDDPQNLVVLRDATTGEAVLVDYPHYEEIDEFNPDAISDLVKELKQDAEINGVDGGDILSGRVEYSIIEHFEHSYGIRTSTTNYGDYTIKDRATAIVNNTLNISLPDGIDSIDARSFFLNTNNNENFSYINLYYEYNQSPSQDLNPEPSAVTKRSYDRSSHERKINNNYYTGSNKTDIKKIYSDDSYSVSIDSAKGVDIHAGLFSGFYLESIGNALARELSMTLGNWGLIDKTYNQVSYVENHPGGNDHLTSIVLDSINKLPAYAFESCENLQTVKFGSEMQEIDALPFKDCKNLYYIDTTDNNKYGFSNMLLFDKSNADAYTIIQCLEGVGKGNRYGATKMDGSTNPELEKVAAIDPQAFAYCENLIELDLSKTSVSQIPENCFEGSSALAQITLPQTTVQVDDNAFAGIFKNATITVPNPSCVLSDSAFTFEEPDTLYHIRGIKYIDENTQTESPLYISYKQILAKHPGEITFDEQGKSFVLTFLDNELELIATQTVTREEVGGVITQTPTADELWSSFVPTAPNKTGYKFVGWISRVNGNVLHDKEVCQDIKEDRTIIAVYESDPKQVYPDDYGPYTLTIVGGTGSLVGGTTTTNTTFTTQQLEGGTLVLLMADTVAGSTFSGWTIKATDETNTTDYSNLFDDTGKTPTTFTMPNANVTVTANFTENGDNPGGDNPGGNNPGGDNPGGNNPGDGDSNNGTKYKLTVNYGSGSGEYSAGETVSISAYAPESSNRVFSRWTTSTSGLGFANATSITTTIVMPATDATVTANYRARSDDDDDDDDDDSGSRRPGTNTSTTVTGTNTPNNSGTTTTPGTVTNPATDTNGTSTTPANGGSRIYITKNGVSNKDVASVTVEGSTDNFIVKITETAEATAAVEEALINRYGSLDGLVYFPMDISLYDSTGENKITDTYGLNITVTMPIPDVLIQYGGNSRVAAADNGNLQQLTPRFTTIDGIACISFVPPHFSPYVIYVDTSNLVAGQTLDSTPSTGDPIHPKWFLAIGMACVSVILFATSDGRKRRGYKTA